MPPLTKFLARYANQADRNIRSYVSEDALNALDPIDYLKDVTTFGCVSGVVNRMVYCSDTQHFFDENYAEIENLRMEYEKQTGLAITLPNDLKNDLAWFAYQFVAEQLLSEIQDSIQRA